MPRRMDAARCSTLLFIVITIMQISMSQCQLQDTTTLPRAQSCSDHQEQVDDLMKTRDYFNTCFVVGKAKDENKSLEMGDVLACYKPQCNTQTGHYIAKQCGHISAYCWCSTPDGTVIDGTFQSNMPTDYCSNLKEPTCEVNGTSYVDGQIFTPSGFCGLCECSGGTYTNSCFVNVTVDETTGQLSSDQLTNVKTLLIKVFASLCNSSDDVDIRLVLKSPSNDAITNEREVLLWKFNDYDRNGDKVLNPSEEFTFLKDINTYFGCSKFHAHLQQLLNMDADDKKISLQEWLAFFGVNSPVLNESNASIEDQQPVKRDATHFARKPLHLRKKFHYVFSDGQDH